MLPAEVGNRVTGSMSPARDRGTARRWCKRARTTPASLRYQSWRRIVMLADMIAADLAEGLHRLDVALGLVEPGLDRLRQLRADLEVRASAPDL